MAHNGGHEPSDLNLKGVAIFVVLLILIIIFANFMISQFMKFYVRHEAEPAPLSLVHPPSERPPGPGLLVDAPQHLSQMRAQEEGILNSRGWIDRGRGIVRIPIGQAIDLVARHGLPEKIGETPETSREVGKQ